MIPLCLMGMLISHRLITRLNCNQSMVALRPTFETLHLNRVPEGHVSKRKVASVNYAREAPKEKDIK